VTDQLHLGKIKIMKKISILFLLISEFAFAQNKITLTVPGGGMTGPVTVVTANGFGGTVVSASSVPAITLNTNQTGFLEGNGTSMSGVKIGFDLTKTNDTLKFTNVANVLYFGAVADDATDNTAAFQAAVNTGLPVFVPSGTFRVATSVNLLPNQTLFGHGWTSIIKIVANTRAVVADSGAHITGIKFIGNGKAGSGTFNSGISLNTSVGGSITNCMFQDFAGDPVLNGGGGIFGSGIHTANSDGWRIINNYFLNNDCGLNLPARAEYVTVTANTFGANTVAILAAAGNLTINDNVIQNNTTGIKTITATNGAHSTINNNLINHNVYPLWFEDADFEVGFAVSNNMIYFGSLKFINTHNVTLSNNRYGRLDSIHLDNATFLTRIGGWLDLSATSVQVPINKYNGAEDFTILGETRYDETTPNRFIDMQQDDTVALKGPFIHKNLNSDAGTNELRYNTTTGRITYSSIITRPTLTKNATIENPTASENMGWFRTPVAITITNTHAVLVGTGTPSVTYQISFGTDITSLTNVYTAGQTVTSTTTGDAASGVNDATIPANSWIRITTSASTTTTQIFLSITYTED
jgi:hypothetical protein